MTSLTSSERRIMLVVLFAIFTDALLYSVVIPFLPGFFTNQLHIPDNQGIPSPQNSLFSSPHTNTPSDTVQYYTSLSLSAFGITELLSTWLTGYLTTKSTLTPFLTGTIIMFLSTILLFVPISPTTTILARLLQGGSTATVWVAGLGYMVAGVREEMVGVCMGYVVVAEAFGQLVGPILGGAGYEVVGHWGVFGVVEGCVGVDIVLRLVFAGKGEMGGGEEGEGEVGETDALLGNETRRSGEAEGQEDAMGKLNGMWWYWVGNVFAVMVAMICRCALEATVPLFLTRRFSWSSAATGTIIFGLLFPIVLAPAVGKGTTKYGPRWFSVSGFTLGGIFLIGLGTLTHKAPATQILWAVLIPLIGICAAVAVHSQQAALSMSIKPAEQASQQAVKDGHELGWRMKMLRSGIMLSGLNTAWSLGEFIGPMLANLMRGTATSWWWFCFGLGILSIVTGACCIFSQGQKAESEE